MDYSKLSNEELLALKAGDYSKLSDETLIALKSDSPAPQKGVLEGALGQAKQIAGNTPMGQVAGMMDTIQTAADKTGEFLAEDIAQHGIKPGMNSDAIKVNPNVAAGIGTTAQMAPSIIASMATPVKEMGNSALGKALTRGGANSVGAEIGAIDKAAGIQSNLPTVSNTAKKLGLPARERQFADIVNRVRKNLDAGEPISPQELSDFKDLVRQEFGTGKIAKGSRFEAVTSKTEEDAVKLLNKLIPERAGPSAKYAEIKRIHASMKKLAKVGKSTGLYGGGAGLAAVILKKLAGK